MVVLSCAGRSSIRMVGIAMSCYIVRDAAHVEIQAAISSIQTNGEPIDLDALAKKIVDEIYKHMKD